MSLLDMTSSATTQSSHTRGTFLHRLWRDNPGVIIALALFVIIVPFLPSYWVRVFTSMMAVAAAAQGVAVLHERLGHVSLAGIALMAVGGWVSLRFAHAFGLPFEVNLIVAAVGSGVVGAVLGLPGIRHKGLIFALVTLMFAAGLHVVVSSIGFPDGGSGFWGRVDGSRERQMMQRPALAQSDRAYFIYATIIVAFAFAATYAVLRSSAGRAWAMIRAGDTVAKSAGVKIGAARFKAFGLAGALSGIGGTLMAGSIGQLDGRSFDALQSLLLYGLVIVAGPWSLAAALIAAFLYRVFPALLDSWGIDGDVAMIIFGIALIHAIVSAPRGIAGQLQDLFSAVGTKLKGSKDD
ncbi:branched-chain amino acid ABC transporter permease [Yoonia sp. R2331]|uniref:branched-chain amino acid ABC transporter permease n=1 Tax=Yoonia sp. R2331 TaxID=3237238 RepID=UPI0034E59E9C